MEACGCHNYDTECTYCGKRNTVYVYCETHDTDPPYDPICPYCGSGTWDPQPERVPW